MEQRTITLNSHSGVSLDLYIFIVAAEQETNCLSCLWPVFGLSYSTYFVYVELVRLSPWRDGASEELVVLRTQAYQHIR